jgi:hypothetical protein
MAQINLIIQLSRFTLFPPKTSHKHHFIMNKHVSSYTLVIVNKSI